MYLILMMWTARKLSNFIERNGRIEMFWNRFIELCEEHNIKPNSLGKILGVSSATLTKWKNGVVPRSEILIKIADYFNVSVDYLLGRVVYKRFGQSIVVQGTNNIISNLINNDKCFDNPFGNEDVWNAYLSLNAKDKIEISLDILSRRSNL